MRLLLLNHLENAIEALRANRLRTFLTITGVTIGIASISAVLSLAGGASKYLADQVATTSESVALVRSSQGATIDTLLTDSQALHTTSTLTEKDVNSLGQIPEATVAPMATLHTGLSTRDSSIDGKRATLIGSNSSLNSVANLELVDGQFLTDNNGSNGIILGNQLAIDLLGSENSLGSVVNIRGENFTVIGTLKPIGQPINYLGVDFDRSAIIQLAALKKFTQNVAQIQQIAITVDESADLDDALRQAEEILSENHQEEKDYVILVGEDITTPSSQLFAGLVAVVTIIAGISLLVGGIGIMNIMLVNVAERRLEVGIRKAIGATDTHIINQFLIESSIVGLLGGVFGYAIGLASAFILGMYLPFTPVLEWEITTLSISVAIITGVLSGIYPAIQAAKKDPIESLHH